MLSMLVRFATKYLLCLVLRLEDVGAWLEGVCDRCGWVRAAAAGGGGGGRGDLALGEVMVWAGTGGGGTKDTAVGICSLGVGG